MPENIKPVVAVDIGGTKMMTAIFSTAGKIIAKETLLTLVEDGADGAIERLCGAIKGRSQAPQFGEVLK